MCLPYINNSVTLQTKVVWIFLLMSGNTRLKLVSKKSRSWKMFTQPDVKVWEYVNIYIYILNFVLIHYFTNIHANKLLLSFCNIDKKAI